MSIFEDFDFMPHGLEGDTEFMPLFAMEEEEGMHEQLEHDEILPVLAVKNTVLFPGTIIPITVGREKSRKAIDEAYENDRIVAVLSQRDSKVDDPMAADMYQVGTISRIVKLIRMPDGTTTAIIQGRRRFTVTEMVREMPYMKVRVAPREMLPMEEENNREFDAVMVSIREMSRQIIDMSPHMPAETILMYRNISGSPFLLNFIAANIGIKLNDKQRILECDDLMAKARMVMEYMDEELQLLQLKTQIESKVRIDMDKQQRDYFLNQQLKTIQEELGQNNPQEEEIRALLERSKVKDWPKAVEEIFHREIKKVRRINPQVAEYAVMLNYLELLLDLPWTDFTEDNFDLRKVKQILDKDHSGLEDVKERILEHLAVLKLKGDMKAPILCLVGPPGVGKTSLGKSIANALGRKFIRMSLGGLRDESEIRGHRKTYIGAMPGRIIKSIRKIGSSNPVFILDEIDKVGKDFRGDPSSALLEVLDPEQNTTFHDNYLEADYDLSKVMFIATANSLSTIQPALRDRMEIIELSGYSLEEKQEIATKHLIPKQRQEHGLKAKQIKINKEGLTNLIANYTRESGVRNLNRQIAGLMRSAAKKIAMEDATTVTVGKNNLKEILGPQKFSRDAYMKHQVSGVAVGLAWTNTGGDILFIEASLSKGKGRLTLTGNLGNVMKESATTALSYIKANAEKLGIPSKMLEENDIHIHVPEGAIPKDGPSAGITMLTALVSVFQHKKVKPYLAMTGEITLRGKVLPVGGIKEKILAAKRAGIKTVILCKANERHVEQINPSYIKKLKIHYVEEMEEVIGLAIGH